MIIVSHRGNTNGCDPLLENTPIHIKNALKNHGILVEVDVRIINGYAYLGHDGPNNLVDRSFLSNKRLILHAKDLATADLLAYDGNRYHWFYHTDEDVVQTSYGWLWSHNGNHLKNGISVVAGRYAPPEGREKGICTDYI